MSNQTLLQPAGEVDVTDIIPRYEASARAYRLMAGVAIGRTLELVQRLLPILADRFAVEPLAGDDWTLRMEDVGTPWIQAISATRSDGSGFLYASEFEPLLPNEALLVHAPELLPETVRRRLKREEDIEPSDLRVQEERSKPLAALHARIKREGITDDVLYPMNLGGMTIQAFKRKPTRTMTYHPLTLLKALDALRAGTVENALVSKSGPDRADRKGDVVTYRAGHLVRDGKVSDVMDALRVLNAAVRVIVPSDLVKKRNAEIGERVYETLFTDPEEVFIQELAQGLVHSDGGLMGTDTREELNSVLSRDIEREVAGAVGDLVEVLPLLREAGHDTRKGRYEANDGRTAMWTRHPDSHLGLALMCSGHATYVARLRGDRDILELAHVGGPNMSEARIDLDAALALDAPGMRGVYLIHQDGSVATLNAPPSGDAVRAEIHDIVTMIGSVASAARDDYGIERPTP